MAQTFFPIDPVNKTPGAIAWQDVDCSANIPSGATGVILHYTHDYDADALYAFGLRKNGSTDNRIGDTGRYDHLWAMIGVDANRIFEVYLENLTYQRIYLVGYTMSGATFFTNAYDKSLSTYGAWTDIDCSTEAPSAIALIFEHDQGNNYNKTCGYRKNGSTDARQGIWARHSGFGQTWGCDANQIVEAYVSDSYCDTFLLGYITDGITTYTNAIDYSLGTINTWLDLTALPVTAVMGCFELASPSYDYRDGFRKNGSAENIVRNTNAKYQAIVECDANRLTQGYITNLDVDFWLVWYATAPPVGRSFGYIIG